MSKVDRFVEDLIDKNIVLMRENAELRKAIQTHKDQFVDEALEGEYELWSKIAVHANEQKTQVNVNTEAK